MESMGTIAEERCYCNVTGRWFTPRRVVHGQGACIYCDANRRTYDEPGYDTVYPQWHPLLSTIADAAARARLLKQEGER